MPFFLDGNPTPGEISEAVNYVLANLNDTVVANQGTGQIVGPSGEVTGYLYKYISIKYADSFDGTLNFSNFPTGRSYYGIRNSDSSVESTNPADYVWNLVTGGFGTTLFLWYIIPGGRQISFQVSATQPNPGWVQDSGTSIDLDYSTTAVSSPANFVVIRVPNDSSAPTNAEVLAAIGRDPIDGDLCIVNYNSGIFSLQYRYTSGWAIFQKVITGDLIVANSIVGNNIASNTITATQIAAATISASNMAANSITAANAAIGNAAVNTLQIAGQAVTIPLSAYTSSATSLNNNTIQSITYTSTGAPVIISSSFTYSSSNLIDWGKINVSILRNGIVVYSSAERFLIPNTGGNPLGFWSGSITDTPGPGLVTYSIYTTLQNNFGSFATFISLSATEAKR